MEKLLKPVSQQQPAGEDLSLSANPAFVELEVAAKPAPVSMVQGAPPSEKRDFADIEKRACLLLEQTKDVRVAVHLTRAWLHSRGYSGLSEGLRLVRLLLESFWHSVHPQLDEEDGDCTERHGAVGILSGPEDMLPAARNATVLKTARGERVTFSQLLAAAGSGEGDAAQSSWVDGALRASPSESAATAAALAQAKQEIEAIGEIFHKYAGRPGPDLSRLGNLLGQAQGALSRWVPAEHSEAAPGASSHPGSEGIPDDPLAAARSQATSPGRVAAARSVVVDSRADVAVLLGKIREYYERSEPSSPVPVLIQRCERLCAMSFREIVQELAPAGVKELNESLGKAPAGD